MAIHVSLRLLAAPVEPETTEPRDPLAEVRTMRRSIARFLRALHGLSVAAARIGERDEQERCELFLRQLDPAWPPADLPG